MSKSTNQKTEARLQEIYERDVKINQEDMQRNVGTAKDFAKGVGEHYSKLNSGDGCSVQSQGSAFEGVKTGAPDEFDFVHVHDYTNRQHLIKPVQSEVLPQFYKLQLQQGDGKQRDWVDRHAQIGDDGKPYLSPQKYRGDLQTAINEYTEEASASGLPGVAGLSHASIRNPAATVAIKTKQGGTIDVDNSVGIKTKLGEKDAYFIAKKHPDHPDVYWQRTENKKEMERMGDIDENQKENYRLAKHLLKDVTHNTYQAKTTFLHMQESTPKEQMKDKSTFLKTMIGELADAYEDKELPAYGAPRENLLAKYDDKYLDGKAKKLRNLENRCDDDFDGVIDELAEKAKK